MTATLPSYVSAKDIAACFGISVMTVYRLINDGDLDGVRIGRAIRIPVESVERYAEDNMIRIGSMASWTARPPGPGRRP